LDFERHLPDTDELQRTTACFYVPPMISSNEPLDLDRVTSSLLDNIEAFTTRGSNWVVSQIHSLSMTTGLFRPLTGSFYIKTLPDLVGKHCILNVRNHSDNSCFQYSILAALHPPAVRNDVNNRCTYNRFFSELDLMGVAISSIPRFESQNPTISVNVLIKDEKNFVPTYTAKFCNERPNHVNLLLLPQGDKYHYVLVTSLSKLVADRTNHVGRTFICPYCLYPFRYQHCLDNHLPACGKHLPQTVKYPKERENILKFDKIQHMFPVPFVLYTDFESYLTSSEEHVPSGFCCLRVSKFPEHDHNIFTYSGDNVL